ncbi:MAG TPA: hypothetical protein PLN42_11995, partial [Anaerolineae bacterium]|nr:hypothetical protein [Anaerolineae bacterium]
MRYKQTALGIAWIVLQPLLSTVIFAVIFGMLLGAPSQGAPYALFALAALAPWRCFCGSLAHKGFMASATPTGTACCSCCARSPIAKRPPGVTFRS